AVDPTSVFELYPVSPNPFSSFVNISYCLPHDGNVRIIVYDIVGREVFALADQFLTSGVHSVLWDGRNTAGQRIESGIYFCIVEIDGCSRAQRITLLCQ
ncbi:MAG: T9SS type A sorting domain-containing protein, partial [Candidatus Aegiribacteria sp.]|nr:T9SS type A sorting domain-containing protein [Candidatus Aegiribacteria sp.]